MRFSLDETRTDDSRGSHQFVPGLIRFRQPLARLAQEVGWPDQWERNLQKVPAPHPFFQLEVRCLRDLPLDTILVSVTVSSPTGPRRPCGRFPGAALW
jgi:hypothetical protein